MGVPLVYDRVRFDPIKQGVTRAVIFCRHLSSVPTRGNLQQGRVARVDISERIPERRICPDARLERFIRHTMRHE